VGVYSLVLVVGVDQFMAAVSPLETIVVLYVGPDQILPLASALGAAVGVLLIVWHRMAALCRRLWQLCSKKAAASGSEPVPHTEVAPADGRMSHSKEGSAG
jgi:hypothetical protein